MKLYDVIALAYWTWCFSFEDIQSDLMDVLKLIVKDGISAIGIDPHKVIYLHEYDLVDVVDILSDYVVDILQEIKENEYVDIENY
jgi:hypothetical protein